jgi:hypothetical protein
LFFQDSINDSLNQVLFVDDHDSSAYLMTTCGLPTPYKPITPDSSTSFGPETIYAW